MKNSNWFKKVGLIFVPVSIAGTLLLMLTIAFCVTVLIAVDRQSHSVTDTLYGIFPSVVSAFTVLFWVANNNCIESSEVIKK